MYSRAKIPNKLAQYAGLTFCCYAQDDFYKKLLCHNNVVFHTVCKLATNRLQRLSSLYCLIYVQKRPAVAMYKMLSYCRETALQGAL